MKRRRTNCHFLGNVIIDNWPCNACYCCYVQVKNTQFRLSNWISIRKFHEESVKYLVNERWVNRKVFFENLLRFVAKMEWYVSLVSQYVSLHHVHPCYLGYEVNGKWRARKKTELLIFHTFLISSSSPLQYERIATRINSFHSSFAILRTSQLNSKRCWQQHKKWIWILNLLCSESHDVDNDAGGDDDAMTTSKQGNHLSSISDHVLTQCNYKICNCITSASSQFSSKCLFST